MKKNHLVFLGIVGLFLCESPVFAGCWVDMYWPLNDSDIRYFTNATIAGSGVTLGTDHYSGNDWKVWQDSEDDYVYEIHRKVQGKVYFVCADAGWVRVCVDPPVLLFDDDLLKNGGSRTTQTTATQSGVDYPATFTVTISMAGTVTAPAGTFSNCRNITVKETAYPPGQPAQSAEVLTGVLAPRVGLIKKRVIIYNELREVDEIVWVGLVSGTVGGINVTNFAGPGVPLPARITAQPRNLTVTHGLKATFSVTASGSVDIRYQWLKDGAPIQNDSRVSGAQTAALSINAVRLADEGQYSVTISNAACVVQSTNAMLDVVVDVPKVTITYPANGQPVSSNVVTVRGTATDSLGLSEISLRVNAGSFVPASTTNNWTNWTSVLSVPSPGTNWLVARAVDLDGGMAYATNRLQYVVSDRLMLVTVGNGTVNPTNGTMLEIEKLATLTAVPGPGFILTNWTVQVDGVTAISTNRPPIQFVMKSNLVLTVTFADIQRPGLAIQFPLNGARVLTNSGLVTVRGTAIDNWAVTNVFYQLNGGDWTNGTTANNWTNWSATVAMRVGTNVVRVYAQDQGGNRSPTNAVAFQHVVTSPLTLQIVGKGTVSGATNGQPLEIGRNYTLTATPGLGFVLTNWSTCADVVLTNKPVVRFLMESNLCLRATFEDVQKPTLAIGYPTAGARVLTNSGLVTVRGTASDNWGVTNVVYQLNGGDWTNANTANNFTNWNVTVAMQVGTNVVRVYAQDQGGNRSATNRVSFQYVVTSPVTLQLVGKGTVVGLTNSQPLELGRAYQFNALAALGFVFTNWTVQVDGITVNSTNRLPIRLTMQSNLVLRVTFTDVQKPVLTIVSPLSGARITNELATVRGKVTDNGWVEAVQGRLNGGDWWTASGTTNWQTDLTLQPGTNWFEAYATDREGLRSATNRAAYFRVVTNLMTATKQGKGTLTPDYNGKWLELGRRYSMTATPGLGFVFTNWTDAADQVVTNKSVVSFMMSTNLMLRANFVDVQKPVLTITSPLSGTRITNELATVRGKVTDNGWVETVTSRLNGGAWGTALGTTNWQTDLTLQPGTNWFEAYATDREGLRSATNRAAYFRVVTNLMILSKSGSGTIVPDLNGKWLELGRRYSITATPALRHLFAGWSGSDDFWSTNPVLNFLMQSNLTRQANFVTNPFVGLKGTYYGLFSETNEVRNHDRSGSFTLTLAEAGSYSASFHLGAATLPATGKFDWLGQTWLQLKPSLTNTVTVALQLDVTNYSALVAGVVSNQVWWAPLLGYRGPVYSLTNAAAQAGRYTLVIPGSDDAAASPGGDGYGTVTVSKAGLLTLAGKLADGTILNQSIPVSSDGLWALSASLYTSKGSLLGWMTFTNEDTSDISGMLSWIKPALATSKYYPLGFISEHETAGSRYVAPGTTNRVLNFTNGVAAFTGGNLPQSFTNAVLLRTNNQVLNLSSNKLTLTLTLTTGLFTGSVTDTNTGKSILFNGALLQKLNAGYGHFLGTNQSGQVMFQAAP